MFSQERHCLNLTTWMRVRQYQWALRNAKECHGHPVFFGATHTFRQTAQIWSLQLASGQCHKSELCRILMSAQALLWQRVQCFNVSACLSSLFLQMFVSRAPRTHNTETWAKKSFRRFVALKSLYMYLFMVMRKMLRLYIFGALLQKASG